MKYLSHEDFRPYSIIILSPGSLKPPSSHYERKITLSLAEIIFIGVLTGLGLAMAMVLIIFNIAWRSNK